VNGQGSKKKTENMSEETTVFKDLHMITCSIV